MNMQI